MKRLGAERVRAARIGRAPRPRAQRSPGGDPLLARASDPRIVDDAATSAAPPGAGDRLDRAGAGDQAELILGEARLLASTAQDDCADAHALVQQQVLKVLRAEAGASEEAVETVETVVSVFERRRDEHGLCRARRLEALVHWNAARAAAAVEAWERAAAHARRAGDEDERSEILSWIATSLFFGPARSTTRSAAARRSASRSAANPGSEAWTLRSLPVSSRWSVASRSPASTWAPATRSSKISARRETLRFADIDGIVEMLAGIRRPLNGDSLPATACLRQSGDRASADDGRASSPGRSAQGRDEEAMQFTKVSEELAADDDLLTQIVWRRTRAGSSPARVDAESQALAHDAVTIASRPTSSARTPTPWPNSVRSAVRAGRHRGSDCSLRGGPELVRAEGEPCRGAEGQSPVTRLAFGGEAVGSGRRVR